MSDILIIKVKHNGAIGLWADSNHKELLPKPVWKVDDTIRFVNHNGEMQVGIITTVYLAQDVEMLMDENKGRYIWHYGIEMVCGYPATFMTEWDLLEWNPDTSPEN